MEEEDHPFAVQHATHIPKEPISQPPIIRPKRVKKKLNFDHVATSSGEEYSSDSLSTTATSDTMSSVSYRLHGIREGFDPKEKLKSIVKGYQSRKLFHSKYVSQLMRSIKVRYYRLYWRRNPLASIHRISNTLRDSVDTEEPKGFSLQCNLYYSLTSEYLT
jgi:hypothetical protein